MTSAMIERAELPVQRNRTLYGPCMFSRFRGAAGQATAERSLCRLCGADESAHEFAVDERRNLVHFKSGGGKKIAGFLDFVNARRFDVDVLKTGAEKFVSIFKFFESTCDAADPKLDTLANVGGNFAADDDIGDGKAATGLQDPECFAQDAVFITGKIDDAVGDDHVNGIFRQRNIF